MRFWKPCQGILKLAVFLLLIPLIAWFFGFRRTYRLWQESRIQQERLEYLRSGEKDHSFVFSGLPEKQVLNDGALLEYLSDFIKRNSITIMKYTPCLTRKEGGLQLYTGELVLGGDFISLLKMIRYIELHPEYGQIVSTAFEAFTDRNMQKKQLKVTLIIQQLTRVN